jgi:hypothetical protein
LGTRIALSLDGGGGLGLFFYRFLLSLALSLFCIRDETRRQFLAELIYKFGNQWAQSMRVLLVVQTFVFSLQSEFSLSFVSLLLSAELTSHLHRHFVQDSLTKMFQTVLFPSGLSRAFQRRHQNQNPTFPSSPLTFYLAALPFHPGQFDENFPNQSLSIRLVQGFPTLTS